MGQERHVIKRQVIEVTLADKSSAWPIQQALSRLFQYQIPALLDRHLSACGLSGEVHRIDYLELDLGELDGNRLEHEVLEKLDWLLPQALQQELTDNPNRQVEPSYRQHLELLEHFLREGTLPWWADTTQSHMPEQSLHTLLQNAPDALLRLLSRITLVPVSLHRLIRYFNDGQLTSLVSAASGLPQQLAESLVRTLLVLSGILQHKTPKQAADIRLALWQSLLQTTHSGYPPCSDRAGFFNATVTRWASLLGISRSVVYESIAHAIQENNVVENEWLNIPKKPVPDSQLTPGDNNQKIRPINLADDNKSRVDREEMFGLNGSKPEQPVLSPNLGRTEDNGQSLSENTALEKDNSKIKPFTDIDQLDATQYQSENHSPTSRSGTQSEAINQAVQPSGLADKDKDAIQQTIIDTTPPFSPSLSKAEQAASSTDPKRVELIGAANSSSDTPEENTFYADHESTQEYPNFNDSEVLYIDNAGLCILWPYVARFFESLDLTAKDRFIDRHAQHCAVSLLYYLATGQLDPPEYCLSFNKLLCGFKTSDLFEAEKPLSGQQITACDQLLEAVINNAPILNKMSHDGFRGSFLLRQGTVGAETGNWLLRVERTSYDVVLERFPWKWQWFKLPWMEFPVRVEW